MPPLLNYRDDTDPFDEDPDTDHVDPALPQPWVNDPLGISLTVFLILVGLAVIFILTRAYLQARREKQIHRTHPNAGEFAPGIAFHEWFLSSSTKYDSDRVKILKPSPPSESDSASTRSSSESVERPKVETHRRTWRESVRNSLMWGRGTSGHVGNVGGRSHSDFVKLEDMQYGIRSVTPISTFKSYHLPFTHNDSQTSLRVPAPVIYAPLSPTNATRSIDLPCTDKPHTPPPARILLPTPHIAANRV